MQENTEMKFPEIHRGGNSYTGRFLMSLYLLSGHLQQQCLRRGPDVHVQAKREVGLYILCLSRHTNIDPAVVGP